MDKQPGRFVDKQPRRAFVALAALHAAITMFIVVLFVRHLVLQHEIRSGLATYGLFTGAAAVGLWRERSWGRGLALVIVMGNAGLGTLALLAVIVSRRGPLLGPALLLAGSVILGYIVSRPVFTSTDE